MKIKNKETGEIREVQDHELSNYGIEMPKASSGIKIKKSHKGLLHKNLGIKQGEKIPVNKLTVKSTDSAKIKKQKVFAKNTKKWKHEDGGGIGLFQSGGDVRYAKPNMMVNPEQYPPMINYGVNELKPMEGYQIPNNAQGVQFQQMPNTDDTYYGQNQQLSQPTDNRGFRGINTTSIDTTRIPRLHIGSSNKYFNRAGNNFNDAMKFTYQGVNSIHDPNAVYKFKNGGFLPMAQSGDKIGDHYDNFMTYGNNDPYKQWNNPAFNQNTNTQTLQAGYPNNLQVDQNQSQDLQQHTTNLTGDQELTNLSTQTPNYNSNYNFKPISNFVAAGAAATRGAINTGKGILDTIGNQRLNLRTQQLEAQQLQQSDFAKATNPTPNEQNGYSWQGRNNAIMEYGGNIPIDRFKFVPKKLMAMGGDIDDYNTDNNGQQPNVEAEQGEHVLTPQGLSGNIDSGGKHGEITQGTSGTPMNLPIGSMIFSEKLKDPATGKPYSKLAKKYETESDIERTKDHYVDPIAKFTAETNIKFKNNKLQELFQEQEQNKLNNVHGKAVQKEAMQEQGIMKNGGKLKKAVNGSLAEDYDYNPKMKPIYHPIDSHHGEKNPEKSPKGTQGVTPTGQLHHTGIYSRTSQADWNASNNKETNYLDSQGFKEIPQFGTTPLDLQTIDSQGNRIDSEDNFSALKGNLKKTGNPLNMANLSLQQQMYDRALDDITEYDDSGKFKGYKANWKDTEGGKVLINMWGTMGEVKGNNQSGITDIQKKIKDGSITPKNLTDMRTDFMDSILETRKLDLGYPAPTLSSTPATKDPASLTPIINKPADIVNRNTAIGLPNVGFSLPSSYNRDPNFMQRIDPQYIDPRYLDINPELNDINRGQRAFQNNLGSRGTTDISNLLQSQVNKYGADQKAYSEKYRYDQGQDANAQQFNANSKTAADQFNVGQFNNFTNNIAKREDILDTQKRTDAQAAIENEMKARNYDVTKDYIQKVFNPMANWSDDQLKSRILDLIGSNNPNSQYRQPTSVTVKDRPGIDKDETDTKYSNKKNGGKVKLRPKLKKKIK